MNPLLPYNAFITHMAAQPTLPSFYWQVYSYEQRIKEICIRLQRCILYNDYTVENVNELIDLVNNLSARVDELNDQIQDVNKRLLEEIERATAAEEEITNNLNDEIERAKAAEAELSTRIDKVSADLATETERAKQAEAALDAKIEAETNRATQKENELQTAIDEIQPPNALTPTHVEHVPTAGTNGYAWGEQATTKTDGIAVGFSADSGRASVAIGSNSYAGDNSSDGETKAVAVGITSHADDGGTAIGHNSNSGEYSVAIGEGAEATVAGTGRGRGAVAIGSGSIASQDLTVSVGNSTLRRRIIRVDTPTQDDDAATKEYVDGKIADIPSGTVVDVIAPTRASIKPVASGDEGLAIGDSANATGMQSVALGHYTTASGWKSVAVGYGSASSENNTFSVGTESVSRRIVNVTDPTNAQDAATKNYVDSKTSNNVSYPNYSTRIKQTQLTGGEEGEYTLTTTTSGYLALYGNCVSATTERVTVTVYDNATTQQAIKQYVCDASKVSSAIFCGDVFPVKSGTTLNLKVSHPASVNLTSAYIY